MKNVLGGFRVPRGMGGVRLLLGGWTWVVMAFLYLPIVLLVIYSFNDSQYNATWAGFTLKWYRALWQNETTGVDPQIAGSVGPLMTALKNSLIIAAWVTGMSVLLGTGAAWLLHRYRYRFSRAINTLVFVPIVMPEIIMGISLLSFFVMIIVPGNQALAQLGVAGNPLSMGFVTVIIAHITFCFPFVMLAVQARLAGMDPSLEEAALDLGATPLRAFLRVIMPYLFPAIVSGALLAFTLSMDELIVTYFVTTGKSPTLPIKIFGMAKVGLNPVLNAVSALFIVGTALLVLAAEGLKRINR